MKIFVDEKQTLGDLIVLRSITKWLDFNSKKELGVKINVALLNNDFEKIAVKISDVKVEDFDIVQGTKVTFEEPKGTVWNMGLKHGISFTAKNVKEMK